MFRSYLRLLLFTCGLLVGVQVPGLINDYTQRVEAHLLESREGLKGFNQTAQRFFNGDLQALVRHYRASDDPVFNSDADSIDSLVNRNRLLEQEWQTLQRPWLVRTWHVLVAADPALQAYVQALLADEVKLAGGKVYIVRGEQVTDAATGAAATLPAVVP